MSVSYRGLLVVAASLVAGTVAASSPAAVLLPSDPPVVKTQRALDNLGAVAVSWQNSFGCSGCHKQAETIAALGIAKRSGYLDARPAVLSTLLQGLLTGSEGQDAGGCFSFGGSSVNFSTAVDGRGLESYDTYVSADHRSNLMAAADCLLPRQAANGSLPADRTEFPEAQGTFHTTAYASFVWSRAAQDSGNGVYASASASAVAWLRAQILSIEASPATFTAQDKSMLLAGLARSGAGPSDTDVQRMHALLAADQQADGSWKLTSAAGGGNGHATGEVVYSLRVAGYTRSDSLTDRGTQWLLDHQQNDGSWTADFWTGGSPSAVAPSMWGALALATYPSPLTGLRLQGGASAAVTWNAVEGASSYDLIRGRTSSLAALADRVDLGPVDCLASASPLTSVGDDTVPESGECFFYLMQIRWGTSHDTYGRSSGGLDEVPSGGCPP